MLVPPPNPSQYICFQPKLPVESITKSLSSSPLIIKSYADHSDLSAFENISLYSQNKTDLEECFEVKRLKLKQKLSKGHKSCIHWWKSNILVKAFSTHLEALAYFTVSLKNFYQNFKFVKGPMELIIQCMCLLCARQWNTVFVHPSHELIWNKNKSFVFTSSLWSFETRNPPSWLSYRACYIGFQSNSK